MISNSFNGNTIHRRNRYGDGYDAYEAAAVVDRWAVRLRGQETHARHVNNSVYDTSPPELDSSYAALTRQRSDDIIESDCIR